MYNNLKDFMSNFKKAFPVGVALLIGIIYLYTAAPSMLWLDSGRFVAGAYSLSIPNPPGFPLYMLLGHFFTFLPLGSVIFRIQLLSIIAAVGTLFLVFKIITQLLEDSNAGKGAKTLSGLFGMLALGFSYSFWSQSSYIETFILVTLIESLVLWFLIKPYPDREALYKRLLTVSVLAGVSLGTNPIVASFFPSITFFTLAKLKRLNLKKFITLLVVAFISVVLVYSYIPFRAFQHPFLNWNNASDLSSFGKQVSGGSLNVYAPELNRVNGFTGNLGVYLTSSANYLEMLVKSFTPFLMPFFLLGGYYLWKKSKFNFILLSLTLITNFVLADLYKAGNQENWFLVSWVIVGIFIGLGYFYLSTFLIKIRDGIYISRLALLLAFFPLLVWFGTLNRHTIFVADDYINNLYAPIQTPAIIFGSGDLYDAISYYGFEVAKPKNNVVPVVDNLLYLEGWYRDNLLANPGLSIPDPSKIKQTGAQDYSDYINAFFEANMNKYHIYITHVALKNQLFPNTNGGSLSIDKKYKLTPEGMLMLLTPKEASTSPDLKSFDFKFKTPDFPNKRPDFLEETYKTELTGMINEYGFSLMSLGDFLFKAGKESEAKDYYKRAQNFSSGLPELAARIKDPKLALDQEASASARAFLPKGWQLFQKEGFKLEFGFPPNWWVEQKASEVDLHEPSNSFNLSMKLDSKDKKASSGDYLAKRSDSFGTLQNQGPAQVPNFDSSYIKQWLDKGVSKYQLFLFKGENIIEVLAYPADSSLMQDFNQILNTLKITEASASSSLGH